MPQSRKSQVCLEATPYYHCISRCVRRAFLCGQDKLTGQSYEHRRQWVEDKLLFLPTVFAIDVCAYAVMSNHTHVVLHINLNKAKSWSTRDILARWHQVFKGTFLTQAFIQGKPLSEPELTTVKETAQIYKQRLLDISWFMRVLNEGIARAANKEDECTGRFWEGRFKSQALLDESALLACMTYVELNPIRAQIAHTPEQSDYTSIKQRIKSLTSQTTTSLMPFSDQVTVPSQTTLPFNLNDYLTLIETTARCIQTQKPELSYSTVPSLLNQLHITSHNWLTLTLHFSKLFHGAVGGESALTRFMQYTHKKRRSNVSHIKKLFA